MVRRSIPVTRAAAEMVSAVGSDGSAGAEAPAGPLRCLVARSVTACGPSERSPVAVGLGRRSTRRRRQHLLYPSTGEEIETGRNVARPHGPSGRVEGNRVTPAAAIPGWPSGPPTAPGREVDPQTGVPLAADIDGAERRGRGEGCVELPSHAS